MGKKSGGPFVCLHCGKKAVMWQSDFMYEDYGYDGNGIVQNFLCGNCGTEIECCIPLDEEEKEEKKDVDVPDTEAQ